MATVRSGTATEAVSRTMATETGSGTTTELETTAAVEHGSRGKVKVREYLGIYESGSGGGMGSGAERICRSGGRGPGRQGRD